MSADRIEKKITLRAPLSRVWRALTGHREFEAWFGVKFDRPFTPGAAMRGTIVGTSVDPEVAQAQQAYGDKPFEITIEQMIPEKLFSFRWHPHAVEPAVDYSAEPTTLIAFTLEPIAAGVELTVTESGFDQIPLARRASAFKANEPGWALVIQLIDKYLTHAQSSTSA
jgi:uncharacterized protein YndB with AHSA1/START domain